MMYQQPEMAHLLLDKITTSTINYLKAQIVAGADIIQLFDSWAGILPPAHYSSFAIPYLARICEAIQDVPKTVFAKGAFFALKEIGALSCDVVGLDWNMRVQDSREQVGYNKVLQGNLDPCTLYANEKAIIKATKEMIDEFGTQRHIANLGHGLYPDILPQNVKIFINTVKEYSGELVAKGK
jgi:uroporphyrinogen decarboxylase